MDNAIRWVQGRLGRNDEPPSQNRIERRKKVAKKAYEKYHGSRLDPLPQPRSRSLTIDRSSRHKASKPLAPTRSRLLSLPLDIRLLIWEHAFTGHFIGLYRKNGRLTHGLLDRTNTGQPAEDIPIYPASVRDQVMKLVESSRPDPLNHPPRPKTVGLLALLQTCRLVYSEAIDLLYSGNTFVFLQNQALDDFCRTTLHKRSASIRSIHIHWQFRELRWTTYGSWRPWNIDAFIDVLLWLNDMPQLEHLSVFIQGPLWTKGTYDRVLKVLTHARGTAYPLLKRYVVRLPHPTLDEFDQNSQSQDVNQLIRDPSLPFEVVRPSLGTMDGELADLDMGADVGWRHGFISLPNGETKGYTVWTPTPRGTSWPCVL